ncbi:S-adenosyl-L-methionine-dependent methyltransferase [Penicillium mononematosum]|uniref:S-adenosyl-L-methionine-dependent methyltransferase n=1 Tax=Penicillium mononematosum TaxID=268346 RepID=UPI0025498C81|nr:S-adenosyl-L-methionine-dependent methyltransferase [Penicillium mononematosum]KAJ6184696.1 S-adenosyl-L-methionine-dependent methyltransferase [Penicillium mononematosum]
MSQTVEAFPATIAYHLDTDELASQYEATSGKAQYQTGIVLLRELSVNPGVCVLDIGCGTGLLAAHIASLAVPHGRVVGIDPLTKRIDLARKKISPDLEDTLFFEYGVAQDLSRFGSESFDVVVMNSVMPWLTQEQQLETLREVFRVLKPGGRLGVAGGSGDHPNYFYEIRRRILSKDPYRIYYPDITIGAPKRIAADALTILTREAGFSSSRVWFDSSALVVQTKEELLQMATSSSFGNYVGKLPSERQLAAQEEIMREFEQYHKGGHFEIPITTLIAVIYK